MPAMNRKENTSRGREKISEDGKTFIFILYPVNSKQSKMLFCVPYRTFSIAKHFHTIFLREQKMKGKSGREAKAKLLRHKVSDEKKNKRFHSGGVG